MPERIAFRMNLYPGFAAEYEKRHDEIFPELAQALKDMKADGSYKKIYDEKLTSLELR